jgi:transcriptional regulator with XRE-family HTH domain
MPKKLKKKGNLTILREGLGLTQAEFARRLGVSASLIKKVEEGKRPIADDLRARILAETGVIFVNEDVADQPFSYTKDDQEKWLKEVRFNQKAAAVAARLVLKVVELMLVAAARPGVHKSYQVWNAVFQALERVKNEFHLEKHIEAEMRDRHMIETGRFTVRELRANPALAKLWNFQDDPKLKDDETLLLEKTTGLLPVKELFSICCHHLELMSEIAKSTESEWTDEQKSKMEQVSQSIEKELNQEAEKFIGRTI